MREPARDIQYAATATRHERHRWKIVGLMEERRGNDGRETEGERDVTWTSERDNIMETDRERYEMSQIRSNCHSVDQAAA